MGCPGVSPSQIGELTSPGADLVSRLPLSHSATVELVATREELSYLKLCEDSGVVHLLDNCRFDSRKFGCERLNHE